MAAYSINPRYHSTDSFVITYSMAPLFEEQHNPHKKQVLITIRVGFDLLKSNLLCDYTPSAYSHFMLAAKGFPSSDQPCKSMSQQFTNQAEICDSWCPSGPLCCFPTEGYKGSGRLQPSTQVQHQNYLKHQFAASE